MTADDLLHTLKELASERFDWYRYDEALPCARDEMVATAVRTYMDADDAQRVQWAEAVDVYNGYALVSFAERAAAWALAGADASRLTPGLVAVGWQWQGCEDPCDGIAVLAALYDAAGRLGADANALFARAAAYTPGAHRAAFAEFLTRPDLHNIAQVMGYTLGPSANGLRYLRSW